MALMIRGVIVDLDGTLIDSRRAHALAWKKTLDEEGVRNSLDEIERWMGCDANQLLGQLAGVEAQSQRGQRLIQKKRRVLEAEYYDQIRPHPCSKALLTRLREEGLRFAFMTSANPCELKTFLNLLDSQELMEYSKIEEVQLKRRTPIETAIASLGMNPEELILLGNTPYDVQVAVGHGISAIAFRSGGWSDGELTGALMVYDDIPDLLRKFDESPLSKKARGQIPLVAA